MAELMAVAIVGGYLLIGVFIGGIYSRLNGGNDGIGLIVTFWPIVIVAVIITIILLAPFKLGEWIGDKLNR